MTPRTPPTPRAAALLLAALGLVAAACVPPGAGGGEEVGSGLQPAFPAEPDTGGTAPGATSPDASAPTSTDAPPDDPTAGGTGGADGDPGAGGAGGDTGAGDGAGDSPDGGASPEPDGPGPVTDGTGPDRADLTDPEGDVEPGRGAMDPPDHADIVGASLERTVERTDPDTLTLRIDLHGGAPETSRDDRHTMNLASFYDVDGDGTIDYEVWANLSSTGWGTSQFDNREGTAAYGADDDVAVDVVDGQLVLTFPGSAVGDAERFRWALAAEWGTYEDLQLGTMSRDLAPDDQQPARFPG